MNVIQGGPNPVVVQATDSHAAAEAAKAAAAPAAAAVKAAAKSEATSNGPRYQPHSDGEPRGRRVNVEA